ncbi:MAG: T9SS type A sorting domain-containing protein [Calditrichae bacterium]|nr:T9SS type A sorting domain-containing protein [Calditrichia bacterium]
MVKLIFSLLIILCFMFYNTVWSQGNYRLGSYVIGSGGTNGSVSTNYGQAGTVGQLVVGSMTGSQNTLYSGFWYPPVVWVGIEDWEQDRLPRVYELNQNYPNPFNPSTTIRYALPFISEVSLEIYNVLGQRVRVLVSDNKVPGYYETRWDGRNDFGSAVASGIYVYRMVARGSNSESFVQTRKMLFVR